MEELRYDREGPGSWWRDPAPFVPEAGEEWESEKNIR